MSLPCFLGKQRKSIKDIMQKDLLKPFSFMLFFKIALLKHPPLMHGQWKARQKITVTPLFL